MPAAASRRKAPASPSTPLPPLRTDSAGLARLPLVGLIAHLRELKVPDAQVDAAMDRTELLALAKKQEELPDEPTNQPRTPVVFAMQSNTPMREAPSRSAPKQRPTSSPADVRPVSAATASSELPRESRSVRTFYNLAATMGENGTDNVKEFAADLQSWLDDNNDIDQTLPTSRKGVRGKHNGKTLATVACSSSVNAPECLKVILQHGADALKGISEGKCAALQAATITASLPRTGLDDRCLQELRAMQMQKDLEKTMSPEQLNDTKRLGRKVKCVKCGEMWLSGRYPKPHKFASCDNDGMAPWHEAAVKRETGTLKSAIALQSMFSNVQR